MYGSKGAAIYSVIETAKENGLHPFQYLMYLFEQLPQLPVPQDETALEPFMPWSSSLPLAAYFRHKIIINWPSSSS
jgi:hypothetical protein